MQKWLITLLILILVACNQQQESEEQQDQTPTPQQEAATVEPEETLVLDDRFPGAVMQPGIQAHDGIEVISYNTFTNENGTGWVVMELRNASDEPVPNVHVTVNLLDDENRMWDTRNLTTGMINIPAGYTVPLVTEFVAPPNYADFMALVTVDQYVDESVFLYVGEYDLPSTTDPLLDTMTFPLVIRGTVTNDRNRTLISPVISVALYDSEDQLLGVAHAYISQGVNERGEWLADSTLNFEATFSYLPATNVSQVQVASAGYYVEGR